MNAKIIKNNINEKYPQLYLPKTCSFPVEVCKINPIIKNE